MLSSLDISRLLSECRKDIDGSAITGVEYYRKERAVQLFVKSDRRYALTLSFHPDQSGFHFLPAGKAAIDTREKFRPFAREVIGGIVQSIGQFPNDRMVEIEIGNSGVIHYLIYEALGPNGNLLLLNEQYQIVASLRKKNYAENEKYQPPRLPVKLDPYRIDAGDLEDLFGRNPDDNPVRLTEKNIYGLDYCLARYLTDKLEGATPEEMAVTVFDRLKKLLKLYDTQGAPIYAYSIKGKNRFYPIKLPGIEPAGKFRTISEAQLNIGQESRAVAREESFQEKTFKTVRTAIHKARRLEKKLTGDIEEAADFEKYLQISDLLKINIAKIERGMEKVSVPDLYHDNNLLDIELDPKLNPYENIEWYARRYRKGKEGLDILRRRLEITRQEIEKLNEALRHFETDFDNARHVYPELLPQEKSSAAVAPAARRPYREYRTSTGLTVLVGKTGDDNDRTTFEYARPFELWFHASQCAGSHVVMKFPHKKFEPSKQEIAEVAALAAYHSKARNSAKVPVSYTLRKYIRKPRKAKSGLVIIEREKTVMVEPRELEKTSDDTE